MMAIYLIRIQGRLDGKWSEWFNGLSLCRQNDGTTLLVGEIADQAALHGVITRVRDLGLPLISVCREDSHNDCAPKGGGTGPT